MTNKANHAIIGNIDFTCRVDTGWPELILEDDEDRAVVLLTPDVARQIIDALNGYLQDRMIEVKP
jgi:hypothetical protein